MKNHTSTSSGTNPATQRVDVETALAEVIRLADVADQLSGDYHEGNRAEADLEWAAVNFVREHAKHIAALLQQLAELERSYQESCDITRDWIAANNALSARAEAAERAREGACGLLRECTAVIHKAAELAGMDPAIEPTPESLGGRVAAFLAANAPTHSAGGE